MKDITIIFEDPHMLVVNKPSGIAVESKEKSETLVPLLRKERSGTLFSTHRIDQVTSGVCILAKKRELCATIQDLFKSNNVQKSYLAVVSSGIAKDDDKVEVKLVRNAHIKKAFVNDEGKKSSLEYKKVASSDNYDLLNIEIGQGRFHQIRAILSHLGMPIKGDVKYGARRSNKDRSIHLHAHKVSFKHPVTHEIVSFSAPLPSETLWQYFAAEIE